VLKGHRVAIKSTLFAAAIGVASNSLGATGKSNLIGEKDAQGLYSPEITANEDKVTPAFFASANAGVLPSQELRLSRGSNDVQDDDSMSVVAWLAGTLVLSLLVLGRERPPQNM